MTILLLAQLLLGNEVNLEDSDNKEDEESTESFNPKNPIHLVLKRHVKVMKCRKEREGIGTTQSCTVKKTTRMHENNQEADKESIRESS